MVGRLCLSFPEGLKAQVEELPVTDKRLTRNFPGSLFRLTLNWKTASSHTARLELIISRETPAKLFQTSYRSVNTASQGGKRPAKGVSCIQNAARTARFIPTAGR